MNPGPATEKMIELVGKKEFDQAMWIYDTIVDITEKQEKGYNAETVLDRLKQVYKALHGLRGYLTDEKELAIYASILWNIGVYEKTSLLLDLILQIHSKQRPGPKSQRALDTLIVLLKNYHDIRSRKEPFWEALAYFLCEQEIKPIDDISSETLKTHYNNRLKKQIGEIIFNQRILAVLYLVKRMPKDERPDSIKPWFSPKLLREYLRNNSKQ